MAQNTAADKYFEALTESYDAIIEAIKAGNERGFRVSNNLLAEAQRGQREAVELGRTFASDPTDIGGFYRAMMESTTKAQGREVIEKIVKSQRAAGEAAVEATRDLVSTTAERVRTGVSRVTTGATEEAAKVTKAASNTASSAASTARAKAEVA